MEGEVLLLHRHPHHSPSFPRCPLGLCHLGLRSLLWVSGRAPATPLAEEKNLAQGHTTIAHCRQQGERLRSHALALTPQFILKLSVSLSTPSSLAWTTVTVTPFQLLLPHLEYIIPQNELAEVWSLLLVNPLGFPTILAKSKLPARPKDTDALTRVLSLLTPHPSPHHRLCVLDHTYLGFPHFLKHTNPFSASEALRVL